MAAIQIDLEQLRKEQIKKGPIDLTQNDLHNFFLDGHQGISFDKHLNYSLRIYNHSYSYLRLVFHFDFTFHNDYINKNFSNITYNTDIYNIVDNIDLNYLLTMHLLDKKFIKSHDKRKEDLYNGCYDCYFDDDDHYNHDNDDCCGIGLELDCDYDDHHTEYD